MHEPEPTPMNAGLRAMVRAHLWYGVTGLAIGVLAALVAIRFGPQFLSASPLFTVLALALVGTIALSMLGGLMSFVPALVDLADDD